MLPFKKKLGDMQFLCVYFKGNVSNFLVADYLSVVMFCFVTIVIRLTFLVRKSRG